MRPATRPPIPAILAEYGAAWSREFADKRAADPAYRFRWKQHDGQPVNRVLLPPLREMTQAHCAYCDGFPLDDTGYETIDHFLPKTAYPEHAYSWDNLYLACNCCQKEKEANFDGHVKIAPDATSELLRPDSPGYTFARYFLFDHKTGNIEPNPQASPEEQAKARLTIASLGLNSDGRPRSRVRHVEWFGKLAETGDEVLDDWPYRFVLEDLV